MAKLTTEELIEQFKELTLIELSEFVKAFEETLPVARPPPRRRTSSTSFSRPPATRRSRSSRRCAP